MISVCWDWESLIHYEMWATTVNQHLYVAKLHRLRESIQLKRPNRQGQVVLQHDNCKNHQGGNPGPRLGDFGTSSIQSSLRQIFIFSAHFLTKCTVSHSRTMKIFKIGCTIISRQEKKISGEMDSIIW